MPPRYSYWTILAGGLPTAFRAAEREDLLPTFNRIRDKHPDAEMQWFARAACGIAGIRAGGPATSAGAARSRLAPGGDHKDPRKKFKTPSAKASARERRETLRATGQPSIGNKDRPSSTSRDTLRRETSFAGRQRAVLIIGLKGRHESVPGDRPRRALPSQARLTGRSATASRRRSHVRQEIPLIRQGPSRVARQVGRSYEQLMTADYPFAAILEFDDVTALKAYLDHPVHEQLAQRFFACVDQSLMYDFELWETDDGIRRIRGGVQ